MLRADLWDRARLDCREEGGQRALPRLNEALIPRAHLGILRILHCLHSQQTHQLAVLCMIPDYFYHLMLPTTQVIALPA